MKHPISDDMSREEIVDILKYDLNADTRLSVHRKIDKVLKNSDGKSKILGIVEHTGRSGQVYRFAAISIYDNNSLTMCCGIFAYTIVRTKYDIVYYAFSSDTDSAKFNLFNAPAGSISVNRYTDHVVRRFGERNGKEYYGEQGFVMFAASHQCFDPVEYNDSKIIARLTNGALLGNIHKGKNCFNTYYTDEMIRDFEREGFFGDIITADATFTASASIYGSILAWKRGEVHPLRLIRSVEKTLENAPADFEYIGKTPDETRKYIGDMIAKRMRDIGKRIRLSIIPTVNHEHHPFPLKDTQHYDKVFAR